MSGKEIRAMILEAGVCLWEVADRLGITDTTFSKRLRYDFNDQEVQRVREIVRELTAK